jgi:hypothetical protein
MWVVIVGVCEKCIFFRPVRPRSQLLAAVVDTTEAAVSTALGKIVEDEQKQRDSEAEFKRAQASTEQETWPRQPVMSSYCGLREKEGVYLIAEIKNVGGRCPPGDFQEGRPERKACSDCRHRVTAAGPARDRQRESLITRMHAEAVSAQSSPASPEGLLKAHREGVPTRKAFELSGAYAADGRLAAKPEYLDYCTAFSTQDEYAVCAIMNPHNSCTAWESASHGDMARQGGGDWPRSAGQGTPAGPPGTEACVPVPRSTMDRLRQIREEQERRVAELEKTDPILAAAARAHNQVTYAALVSKISEVEARTQEIIINNMR